MKNQNYSEYIIDIICKGGNVEDLEFPIFVLCKQAVFIYKSYKPDFRALLWVFGMTWIENGLSTLK